MSMYTFVVSVLYHDWITSSVTWMNFLSWQIDIYVIDKSFKSLFQNTTGNNASLYTGNKHTYLHSNTITYTKINYIHYK